MTDLRAAAETAIKQWEDHDVHRQSEEEARIWGEPMLVKFAREILRLATPADGPSDDGERATFSWLPSVGFSVKECMAGFDATLALRPVNEGAAICELAVEGTDEEMYFQLRQGVPDNPKVRDDLICLTSMPEKPTRGQVRKLLSALQGGE